MAAMMLPSYKVPLSTKHRKKYELLCLSYRIDKRAEMLPHAKSVLMGKKRRKTPSYLRISWQQVSLTFQDKMIAVLNAKIIQQPFTQPSHDYCMTKEVTF